MPKLQEYEFWEKSFIDIFKQNIEEEPLYDFFHLYKSGLTPEKAFEAYLKENPDYLEKRDDLQDEKEAHSPIGKEVTEASMEDLVKRAEEMKRKKEALQRLKEFCPNCARKIGDKKRCKCGFKR